MEDLVNAPRTPSSLLHTYQGRRVLVTGHTGFKGAWLTEWLLSLGAEVAGYSLAPLRSPASPEQSPLFDRLGLDRRLHRHEIGDIRDLPTLARTVRDFAPDFVYHLAAQPLVRASYQEPVETFATNVIGTAHLLEAVRPLAKPCAVIIVTTDKCYENPESGMPFTEGDRLGGHDPYSASKAAAELITASYRASFFQDSPIAIASARAGNVIGGGDWAVDRIVPDAIRALAAGRPISVRNPHAVRPFQHVLDPLAGYLLLGAALQTQPEARGAFNFGPGDASHQSVQALIKEILCHWPSAAGWRDDSAPDAVHEAQLLRLATAKATEQLSWRPVWEFPQAVAETVLWYRQAAALATTRSEEIAAFTRDQIARYTQAQAEAHLTPTGPIRPA